jgi:hypothetical protein
MLFIEGLSMLYSQYINQNWYSMQREATSYLRVFHASPGAPPVDVYANGTKLASNLSFSGFTEYTPIPAGRYNVKVFPAGQTLNPVINTDVNILPGTIITAAAVGRLADIELLPIQDPVLPKPPGMANLRFGHLSPNAPPVDIALPDGTQLFTNVGYKQVTNYVPVHPGTYSIFVRPSGTGQNVLYVPNINLSPDRFYTIYAIGLVGETPPLQVVIPLDGNSYIV